MCNYCEFRSEDNIEFRNNLYNYLEGRVRCSDCYWKGKWKK